MVLKIDKKWSEVCGMLRMAGAALVSSRATVTSAPVLCSSCGLTYSRESVHTFLFPQQEAPCAPGFSGNSSD